MPNALPQGFGTRTFTGSRGIFSYNGEVFAMASNISGGDEIIYDPVEVIGKLLPVEHAPTGVRTNLSCATFRTISRKSSPTSGASPGSLKEQNIFPRLNQILRLEGVDVAIFDEITQKVIYMFRQVKPASRNWNIGARGLVMENVGFVTTQMLDEGDPETHVFPAPALAI